jgi:hypothetical protein
MDAQDWKIRYVQRWSALTDGKDDPRATWDHAEAAFLTQSAHLPEAVAEKRFEQLSGE